MTALFLFFVFLFILFFPLTVAAGIAVDFSQRSLSIKAKLFDFAKIVDKTLYYKDLKLIDDKKGKPVKPSFKKSGTKILKAFKIKKIRVLATSGDIVFSSCFAVSNTFDKHGDKFCFYLKFSPQSKLVCVESIISTSLANIIFRLLLTFGEFLWKQLKTRSKRSSTD